MLERGELVVVRRRARDPEAARGQRQLVRAVCECDLEAAAAVEAPKRRQPRGQSAGLPEHARAAVTWPDHVVVDSVLLEQLERLRVLARSHLDLVSIVLQQADQRAKNSTCGELVMSIQTCMDAQAYAALADSMRMAVVASSSACRR